MDQLANIESQVKALWEKAQQAGVLIALLREEKKALEADNEQLQREMTKLRSEVLARDAQIQKLNSVQSSPETKSGSPISNGEREELSAKVKELLARIDAYL